MTLVIVIAQIDISVGSLFAVTSVACGALVKDGMPVLLLPVAALLIGSLLGAVNGGLVSFVKAPSIVVTLATMIVWREALRWTTGGAWVEGLPEEFSMVRLGLQSGRLWWLRSRLSSSLRLLGRRGTSQPFVPSMLQVPIVRPLGWRAFQ